MTHPYRNFGGFMGHRGEGSGEPVADAEYPGEPQYGWGYDDGTGHGYACGYSFGDGLGFGNWAKYGENYTNGEGHGEEEQAWE